VRQVIREPQCQGPTPRVGLKDYPEKWTPVFRKDYAAVKIAVQNLDFCRNDALPGRHQDQCLVDIIDRPIFGATKKSLA